MGNQLRKERNMFNGICDNWIDDPELNNFDLMLLTFLQTFYASDYVWNLKKDLSDYLFDGKKLKGNTLKAYNKSIERLIDLDYICCDSNGHYFKTRHMLEGASSSFYTYVTFNNLYSIYHLDFKNKTSLLKTYLMVLKLMDCSKRASTKKCVYHLGIKSLCYECHISISTCSKHLNVLVDNNILYCSKKDNSFDGFNFYSRYEDRHICEEFIRKYNSYFYKNRETEEDTDFPIN